MSPLATPYARLMRIEPVAGAKGVYSVPGATDLQGRPGFMHGGAIGGVLTVIADALAQGESGDFVGSTSTVRFLRGGHERPTYARAIIRSQSARLLVIEGSAWQESDDKPIAILTRIYVRRGA